MTDPRVAEALEPLGSRSQRQREFDAGIIASTPAGASLLADAAVGAAVREWVEYDGSISRHIDIGGGIGAITLNLFDSVTGDIYAHGTTLAEAWADAMRQYHDEPSFVAELPEEPTMTGERP
jgi:hypothetical protein